MIDDVFESHGPSRIKSYVRMAERNPNRAGHKAWTSDVGDEPQVVLDELLEVGARGTCRSAESLCRRVNGHASSGEGERDLALSHVVDRLLYASPNRNHLSVVAAQPLPLQPQRADAAAAADGCKRLLGGMSLHGSAVDARIAVSTRRAPPPSSTARIRIV